MTGYVPTMEDVRLLEALASAADSAPTRMRMAHLAAPAVELAAALRPHVQPVTEQTDDSTREQAAPGALGAP